MGLIDIRETKSEYRLAPTDDLYFEIVRALVGEGYIVPHPDSPLNNFIFDDDRVDRYLLKMPQWWLPIGGETEDEPGVIAELEHCFAEMDWPDSWFEQVLLLWRKIALHECLEYLDMVLREHGFTFEPGEKTIATFERVLERFSVAQAFNFIWRAGRDAAAYYMRSGIPKKLAANSVVGSIQRMVDKSVAESWEVKGYRRDFRCPQTMVSQVLFDTALQIGDEGFNTIPKKL